MKNKNILIINYSFPPYPGVGGRRWAKFAKYLSQKDYTIHVIHASPLGSQQSLWTNDVVSTKIIRYPVLFPFQKILNNPEPNLFQKINYKILVFFLKHTRYSPHDAAAFGKSVVVNKAIEIIRQHEIKHLIVTGGPSEFYFGSIIKMKTGVRLILDYRDLWSDHSYYSKIEKRTYKQIRYWEEIENTALNRADVAVCVDHTIAKAIRKRIRNSSIRLIVIPNGYDPDDYAGVLQHPTSTHPSEKIRIFFGGSISQDHDIRIIKFFEDIKRLKTLFPKIYNSFHIKICSDSSKSLFKQLQQFNLDIVELCYDRLPINEYCKEVLKADAGIILLSEEYRGSFGVKFYDYIYLNKLILCIGYEGEVAAYLRKYKLGFLYTLESDELFFCDMYKTIKEKKFAVLPPKEKEKYSIAFLAEQYEQILSSL